ncbi:MAG: DNA polymerase III subunit beta [Oscillospiraceae bacterium]
MKFTCEKIILQNAVMNVSRAAASKSPIPALEGILVEAGVGVRLTGYDLKKGIYTTVEAAVNKSGSAIFGAKLFVEMIRRLPDGIISIEVSEDNTATVKCGKAEYTFQAMDADDYPELPTVDYARAVTLPQKLLREMIDETIFAVSSSESRPVYMGSKIEIGEGKLTLISLDGYRMAVRREPLEDCGTDEDMDFIVPGAALADVQRICEDSDDKVFLSVGTKHVSFTINETVVVSRRLEGEFLNFRKAIPEAFRAELMLPRGEFLSVVDRVSLVVDEKTKNPLRLIFNEGAVDFLCVTGVGRAEDSCPCEGDGGGVEIGFNDRYLRDALRAAPCDNLKICINTGSSPCVIFPADGSDKFSYMILPVRLRAGD